MSIYKKRTRSKNYRKIYEQHYGPIPNDEDGRTFEIHHIDGNPENNSKENLVALTIQEHYDIHYSQGDFNACQLIAAQRMNKTPEELSELARFLALKQIEDGTHHWLKRVDGSSVSSDRVKNGTHNFLGGEIQRQTHQRMKDDGTHFSQRESVKKQLSEASTKLMADGVLHKLNYEELIKSGRHPSQIKKTCSHCGKTCSINMFARFHGDKCKFKISDA